jgi:hypothetical protein
MLIDGIGGNRLMPAFSVWKKQWSFASLLIRLQIGSLLQRLPNALG